jgi:rhodanese-related sulfurtransferase
MFDDLEISATEVKGRLETTPGLVLVDVRETWEWEYNHIPGAIHLPMGNIEFGHESALDRSAEIVLYCHTGMRSLQAAAWLRQEGYTSVKSLAGGVNAWADDVSPEMPRY